MSALSRVFQVQPGEGRTVTLVVGLMFVAVAALTVGESGINALFFDRVGAEELPTVYLLQGAVGVVGMLVLAGVLGRFDRRRAYVALPIVLAAAVAAERVLLAGGAAWIYWTLWLTITLAYLLQAVYLWGTAGLVTDTRRAKRLFPLFGAGSILGGVVGGVATRPLASALGAENLLVLWALGLVASSILCASILGVRRKRSHRLRTTRRPSALAELRQGYRFVRRSPLLVWMAIASILFSVLYYSLYQPFAEAAADRFPDPDELAGFFGLFWAAVTAAAFLVSIVLANRLLGWFGAATMILVLPILYLGAFGVLLSTATLAMLVAIRFGVNLWLQGVSSPAWETLINVTPEQRRDQSRAFLNGGPAQVGTAIAGLLLLLGDALTSRQLAIIGLIAAIATAVVVWRVRHSYTSALVDAIRTGRPRFFDDPIPNAPISIRQDRQAVELAATAMGDEDPRMRRLACDLLASADDARATQVLREATHDADGLVRARAVEALASDGRLEPLERDRALADDDALVRAAAVRARGDGPPPAALLRDPDPSVSAAVAVRLLDGDTEIAIETLERLLSHEDAQVRLEAVRSLRDAPKRYVPGLVGARLEDPSAGVRAAAIEALSTADPGEARDAALAGLTSPEPIVREAALHALDRLDPAAASGSIEPVVRTWTALATLDGSTAASVGASDEAATLLRDALLERARSRALVALSATSVTNPDREAVRLALEVLEEGAGSEIANALETLEVAAPSSSVRQLLRLWEPIGVPGTGVEDVPEAALSDEDPFIRACAELVQATRQRGDAIMAHSSRSLSPMELVLVLRGIPLFATLEPAELQRIAAIAEERSYADGELLGAQDELGDEMHIVLEGAVRVVRTDGDEVARRGAGDVVGEMSVITREPRVASLVADGDVRTLRIGHREFESMVRERPDIALAVMRVLAHRLGSATTEPAGVRP